MAKENIFLVIKNEDDVLIFETILSKEGFYVIKLNSCNDLLNIVSTEKLDLVIIDQLELEDGGGYAVLEEIRKQQIPLLTLIKCHWLFNLTSDIRKFIQVGAYDYLPFPFFPSDLIKYINNALLAKNNSVYSPSPIIEKLLVKVEGLQQNNNKLAERYRWYEKNRQKLACDCQEQLKRGTPFTKPKSTSFRKLGRASDGYHIGFKFVCDVCDTAWFCGESHTESQFSYFWEPADENINLIELDRRYYPELPEDYEPF